jgi:Na+-translocating ferredoxin:NAD+ oxidoreductase RNF subunit RnfB
MTSTCPTCGCRTDTPALAFLHEHAWCPLGNMDTMNRLATLMEAYAQQAVEARNREVAEVLREVFDDGFRACRAYGDNAHHHHGEQADRVFAASMKRLNLTHRLGLTTEPPPAAEAEESRQC